MNILSFFGVVPLLYYVKLFNGISNDNTSYQPLCAFASTEKPWYYKYRSTLRLFHDIERSHKPNNTHGIPEVKRPLTIESILKTFARGRGSNNSRLYLEFDSQDDSLTTLLNAHCQDNFTVPPIVHYVWLNKRMMEIHEYISAYSMNKFVKPCYILFHGNRIPGGKWWDLLLTQVHNIVHVRTEPPREIFGKAVNVVEHQADVLRLQILMKYGGIYVDTDTYALRSFDELRKYPITMGQEQRPDAVCNCIILANKDAVFLKLWMLTYHTFNDEKWVVNSVLMAHKLSVLVPSLVHVEKNSLVMLGGYYSVYRQNLSWDVSRYSVHLFARFFAKRNHEIEDLKHLDNTYGALSRYILFGNPKLLPK